MVMLLGAGEKNPGANESCTVHMQGGCVHMVVRGLSACQKFLSESVQNDLNQCSKSWIDEEVDIFVNEYGFSNSDALFAAEGMDFK